MKYQVFPWDSSDRFGEPTLIIGKYLYQNPSKLKRGMLLYRIHRGVKYRVDDFTPDTSEEAIDGAMMMSMTHLKYDGTEGNKVKGYNVAHVWLIKTADIDKEHQLLLPTHGEVDGKIKDGKFIPHPRYLINWHEQYMNYFRFIRSRAQYDFSNPAKSELPTLLLNIIDEIGPAVFNSFIRHYFVGKAMRGGEVMALAHKAMRQVGPIGNDDERKRFAESMLYTAIHMGEDFWEATQAVVYKKGVELDFTQRIR
jgi:hypothetical protein